MIILLVQILWRLSSALIYHRPIMVALVIVIVVGLPLVLVSFLCQFIARLLASQFNDSSRGHNYASFHPPSMPTCHFLSCFFCCGELIFHIESWCHVSDHTRTLWTHTPTTFDLTLSPPPKLIRVCPASEHPRLLSLVHPGSWAGCIGPSSRG